MEVAVLRPGLWRWTAAHPAWRPGDDWAEDVGCVYYEAPDAVALIDPLIPDDEEERFWRALDRDVERLGLPVAVLVTAPRHERSCEAVVARYGAARGELPAGVAALPFAGSRAGEVAFFLGAAAALVVGDTLKGRAAGLDVISSAAPRDGELLDALERMAALEPALVVPSHGDPVLTDGAAALRAAIERYAARGSRR